MGHQANTATQAIARADGRLPDVSVAAGRKGFKAELDDLRERMRKLGLGYDEIAGEIARRYRLRPRESFRLAWGWSLNHAAAAGRPGQGSDRHVPRTARRVRGGAVMTGERSAAGQHAVRGDDRQDRYGVRELTPGELERTRRDLATGLGLTTDDSPLRISLASHLDAVTAQLDRRGHSTQTGG